MTTLKLIKYFRYIFVTFILGFLLLTFPSEVNAQGASLTYPVIPINRKLMVIIFNPYITGSTTLRIYQNYWDPKILTDNLITQIRTDSHEKVKYTIPPGNLILQNIFPQKQDGFTYTPETYLRCLTNASTCHSPDTANYLKLLNDNNVCGKLNSGEIDELWIWGAGYFGFSEANMAGSNAYTLNGPVVTGSTCNKPLPIMGFNYGMVNAYPLKYVLSFAQHSYGHRTEGTMSRVYGSSQQNNISNSWNKFALVKSLSPSYSYSGCGTVHYPPNALNDYDYWNTTNSTPSNCDAFYNYPNIPTPPTQLTNITCNTWGCSVYKDTASNLHTWWFKHIPYFSGFAPDGKLNDWWQYIANPNNVIGPLPQAQTLLLINSSQTSLNASAGTYFTLNWWSEFAAGCVASGAWSGSKSASGSTNLTVGNNATSYTYTLTCGNSAPTSVTITISPTSTPTPNSTPTFAPRVTLTPTSTPVPFPTFAPRATLSPTPSPTPGVCQLTLSPSVLNLVSGGSPATITATVTSGAGSATLRAVTFLSGSSKVAVVPTSDSSVPFTTSANAQWQPIPTAYTTTITANSLLSDGRTCQTNTATDTDVSVR